MTGGLASLQQLDTEQSEMIASLTILRIFGCPYGPNKMHAGGADAIIEHETSIQARVEVVAAFKPLVREFEKDNY